MTSINPSFNPKINWNEQKQTKQTEIPNNETEITTSNEHESKNVAADDVLNYLVAQGATFLNIKPTSADWKADPIAFAHKTLSADRIADIEAAMIQFETQFQQSKEAIANEFGEQISPAAASELAGMMF